MWYYRRVKQGLLVLVLGASLLFSASVAKAAEELVFDSTNNYLGACQLTDKSEWELDKDLQVSKFQIWYNWDRGETELPVTVYAGGVEFAKFTATRSACDPYQSQWCNADFEINKLFPKGKYSTVIPKSKQCLKPRGTGAVRLYSGVSEKTVPTTVPTVVPTLTPTTAPKAVLPVSVAENKTVSGWCNQCLVTAVTSSVVTSLLTTAVVWLVLRKQK